MKKKGFFDELFIPGQTISSKVLLGAERNRFFACMSGEYELNVSMLYNRMFVLGFSEWMLTGVDQIKDDFAKEYPALAEWRDKDMSFLQLCEQENIPKSRFFAMLRKYGFRSVDSTRKRFSNETWKRWERIGMKKILTDYCDRY